MTTNFRENPYRRNAFDAIPLGKDDVDLREIREKKQEARATWKTNGGRVVARDGAEWELTEAQLNRFEQVLIDPLERLKVEQYVHRQHYFTGDAELARLIEELARSLTSPGVPPAVLDALAAALSARLCRLVPEPAPVDLPDDLPWPDAPAALPLELEPVDATLLRDA